MADLFAIFIIMSSLTLAGYIVRLLCRMVMIEQKKFKEKVMRDKYLTEAMGECYHGREFVNNKFYTGPGDRCKKCRKFIGTKLTPNDSIQNYLTDFSTWEGFGKLWEWFRTHQMFMFFIDNHGGFIEFTDGTVAALNIDYLLSPDKLADAVYEFLKEQDG